MNPSYSGRRAALLPALLLLAIPEAQAEILPVPELYPTIVSAVAAASDDDTILVAPGLYQERIVLPPGITRIASHYVLRGDSEFVAQTILEPDPDAHPDTSDILEIWDAGVSMYLTGFTVRRGQGLFYPPVRDRRGGAIRLTRGTARLDHCVFTANRADLASVAWCDSGATLEINACDFHADTSIQATLRVVGADLTVRSSRFHNNTAHGGGAAILAWECNLLMENCVVESNYLETAFMSPVVLMRTNTVVRQTSFLSNALGPDNTSHACAALQMSQTQAVVEDCRFEGNRSNYGAALQAFASECTVRNSVFRSNIGAITGPVAGGYGHGRFENCLFENNEATYWSVMTWSEGELDLFGCCFLNNVSLQGDTLGAISAIGETLRAVNCVFQNNIPFAISDHYLPGDSAFVENCYWGDPSGPYHATLNPEGRGDRINVQRVDFIPWLTEPPLSSPEPHRPLPTRTELITAYPNPFNSSIRLEFGPSFRTSQAFIVNALGQKLESFQIPMGGRHVLWAPQGLSSGIYFVQFGPVSRKIVYLR